jgi:hypothetical protein
MRNAIGTTNKEEPFKREEIITLFDEEYVVLKNYGTRGRVRLINTHMSIDPFYWSFQGMEARRVKRNAA